MENKERCNKCNSEIVYSRIFGLRCHTCMRNNREIRWVPKEKSDNTLYVYEMGCDF